MRPFLFGDEMKSRFLLLLLILAASVPMFAGDECHPANRATIDITSSGDATVIASDSTRAIYVWQFFMVNNHASTDTNVTLKEGSTSVSAAYVLKAGGGSHTAPCTGTPWAIVPAGSAFVINSSASATLKGAVYYTYVR